MIKSISQIQSSVENLREKGIQRGNDTGFKCLDALYSIKPGTFTIVQGSPTHGKSELIFELLINQADRFDKKSIILSPESGNAQEIAMELIHKYLLKSAYKTNQFSCSDAEFSKAFNWVSHYFAIADDEDKSYSFKQLKDEISAYEKANQTKYENVMAEPWNELDHKLILQDNSGRQDLAIEDELTQLRRYCKNENKHTFLSFHPSSQSLTKDPLSGKSYYEMPKAREAAGGQATLRKAFSWINIWRPPAGLIDSSTGAPFEENELLVQIEKSKPKGVGMKGMTKLFFDWQKNRYYEKIDNLNMYAFHHEKQVMPEIPTNNAITPNTNFYEPSTEPPF